MDRPTRPPHDGAVINPNSFNSARQNLLASGLQNLTTASGTPFTAEAHIPSKEDHVNEKCIWIKNANGSVAYIYEQCWGHITNYSGTYIDVYTPKL